MIVKNESKIITRLLDSVIPIIDSYCICDTGSSDNTIDVIKNYFQVRSIPGKILIEEFKDFSYNRNFALDGCAGMSDFVILLDADMILSISPGFNKINLLRTQYDEFRILQGNDNYSFPNTRIIRNNGQFKYFGVTHEYIRNITENVLEYTETKLMNLGKDVLFIKNGGAKTNKYVRDIALLKQGIADDQNNSRYYFYLGNSYLETQQYDLAIEPYKKLLDLNGCTQEKYVSCLRIYEALEKKQEEEKGIHYLILSHQYDNRRIECIYRLVKYYFNKQLYSTAMSFYSLIQDYYENIYPAEEESIVFKLFILQIEYKFLLPYYIILICIPLNNFETGFKMYNILFKNGFIDIGKNYINNLINASKYYLNFIKNNNHEFLINYKNYINLFAEKYNISVDNNLLQDNLLQDNLLEDNLTKDNLLQNNLTKDNTMLIPKDNDIKIILNLMIKNESLIIERCINSVLMYVDAISILDTGSTDNTIDVCYNTLIKSNKSFIINTENFKNFGYNRSISFDKAVEFCKQLGWDLDKTYTMAIDADMVICPSDKFNEFKNNMFQNGYQAIQKNGHITYYNTRFMKCSYKWKCIGATHEYWSGDPVDKIPQDVFYIDDVNDGGCKSNKAERDIQLLIEEIENGKNLDRSHFYLAQTYKGIGKLELSIEYYKKRIDLGGWYEEIWYSHYQIGKCYLELNDLHQMELWLNKAYDYNPKRSEPLYVLTNFFRIHSQHYKAYHYYLKGSVIPFPENEILFIEHEIYNGLFEYEKTILLYYICKTKKESLHDVISYINNYSHHIDNVWNNLYFYINGLVDKEYYGEYTNYNFKQMDEYRASSSSLLKLDDKYLLNIRYVNYTITEQGYYIMHSPDNKVKTKNVIMYLNNNYMPIANAGDIGLQYNFINEEVEKYPSNIEGLEDIRIFHFNEKVYFTASSKNITNNDYIKMVIGEYNYKDNKIYNASAIEPPNHSECEKNWIYIPNFNNNNSFHKMNFIYGWHPLKIGSIDNNKLNIHTIYNTPNIFSRIRGSSHLINHNDEYWGVVHIVKYGMPRVYYHCIVVFSKEMVPKKYSLPFYFRQAKIEYCIGFDIQLINNTNYACFIISENDCNTGFIKLPLDRLKLITIR